MKSLLEARQVYSSVIATTMHRYVAARLLCASDRHGTWYVPIRQTLVQWFSYDYLAQKRVVTMAAPQHILNFKKVTFIEFPLVRLKFVKDRKLNLLKI